MGEPGTGDFLPKQPKGIGDHTKEKSTVPIASFLSTTLPEFTASFASIESGNLYRIASIPSKEEAARLAMLEKEVRIFKSKDGNVYIIKGEGDDENDNNRVGVTKEIHNQLDPVYDAHTHSSKHRHDIRDKNIFVENLPSVGDLTSKGSLDIVNYIFTEYGRTSFLRTRNYTAGGLDNDGRSMTQRTVLNALHEAVREARAAGVSEDAEACLNFMGNYMDTLGCKFQFEPWDKVENIEKPPENFN